MSMKFTQQFKILSIKRYEVEGKKGATVSIEGNPVQSDNMIGTPTLELKADYELFDLVKHYPFPSVYNCEVSLSSGSNHKAALFIHSIVQPSGAVQTPSKKAA